MKRILLSSLFRDKTVFDWPPSCDTVLYVLPRKSESFKEWSLAREKIHMVRDLYVENNGSLSWHYISNQITAIYSRGHQQWLTMESNYAQPFHHKPCEENLWFWGVQNKLNWIEWADAYTFSFENLRFKLQSQTTQLTHLPQEQTCQVEDALWRRHRVQILVLNEKNLQLEVTRHPMKETWSHAHCYCIVIMLQASVYDPKW